MTKSIFDFDRVVIPLLREISSSEVPEHLGFDVEEMLSDHSFSPKDVERLCASLVERGFITAKTAPRDVSSLYYFDVDIAAAGLEIIGLWPAPGDAAADLVERVLRALIVELENSTDEGGGVSKAVSLVQRMLSSGGAAASIAQAIGLT